MKTAIQGYRNKNFSLVIDDPALARDKRIKLADMTHYEGTPLWSLVDVRLHPFNRQPSPYCEMGGGTLHARMHVESEDELAFVKTLLSDYRVVQERGQTVVTWCSWEGIVAGRTAAAIAGPLGWPKHEHAIFHTKSEATSKLLAIQEFWAGFDGTPEEAMLIKIDNTMLQMSESRVLGEVIMRRMRLEAPESLPSGFEDPSPPNPNAPHKPKHARRP